jgi:hypothetical protein
MNAIHARSQLRYWPTPPTELPLNCSASPEPQQSASLTARPPAIEALGWSCKSWVLGLTLRDKLCRWRRPRVSPREPVAQQARRFCRSASIKWHQRRRDARHPHDIGAPPVVGDRGDLDQIGATRDGFLEPMDSCLHVCVLTNSLLELPRFYASRWHKQAKRPTKARAQWRLARFFQISDPKNFLHVGTSTGNSPFVHRICTSGIRCLRS